MVATTPLTLTQPCSTQSSASRREHMPNSAMRLFSREVGRPPTVPVAGAGTWRTGATKAPEATR